ncbi:MAG: YbaK/EbsC family protein [Gammaproteobacteria bacterium]|nr:YbaK/EbsC family protein [Gammaproteobacteria bacterium]
MVMAITLQHYLDGLGVDYEIVAHPYADNGLDTAQCAHIPPDKLAKSIMLEDEGGYLMAVCPASRRIKLGQLYRETNRRLEFADETELADMLGDCALGAVPPVGELYGVDVVVDTELFMQPDVYFEAGDHIDLVHVSADNFQKLMSNAEHASFSKPV